MRLIVLDRDGVINFDSPDFIKSAGEWNPIPGSLEAIARLSAAGWSVMVATNQSGLARGLLSEADLAAIHRRMHREVEAVGGVIAGVYVCPHHPDDACDCRKPRPGLLRDIAHRTGVSLQDVPMVGDSVRDIEAARSVGGRAILVLTGNGADAREALAIRGESVETYPDLAAVAEVLVAENND